MSRKRAQKPAPKQTQTQVSGQHPVVVVTVHADFSDQETAFKLGFYHGYEGVRPRKAESFIHQPTATAYAAGLMAGCAARAARQKS